MDTDEFLLYQERLAQEAEALQVVRESGPLAPLRRLWSGEPYGCFWHRWDDPRGATRVCLDCQRVEVISHL